MRRMPLSLLSHWAGGELHGDDVDVDAVSHDTRHIMPGSLYIALRGERFDGHDFATDAVTRGAQALLVERLLDLDVPQVLVADAQLALARIAAGVQRDRASRVIAVTGSNGKTSTKTLLLAVLSRAGDTYANPGNRNNEIGLPLAVLDAPEDARFAIYEMGAGKPGDIAYLTDIVRPDVALVNNVAAAHLERMGSLLGVATTKGAIYSALSPDGVAVINADDAFAEYFVAQAAGHRILRYGIDATADVVAREVVFDASGARFTLSTPAGDAPVVLALAGRHNVMNALAAATIGLACGMDVEAIADGLADARPVAGRQVAHVLANGAVLIDDSYNANPGSLAAAIATLAAAPGEGWLVLGDMRELGADAESLHADAGLQARDAGLQRLYTLGPLSAAAAKAFGPGARSFDTHEDLAQALGDDLGASRPQAGAAVRCLVKGSRGSAMDRIVTALLPRLAPHEGEASHAA